MTMDIGQIYISYYLFVNVLEISTIQSYSDDERMYNVDKHDVIYHTNMCAE